MKICESWLKDWVGISLRSEEISEQLTMLGLEVDSMYPVAGDFDKVIVAEVVNTKKHPEADRLTLCEVYDGIKKFQVVCGASNVRPGLKVALATCGARLTPDFVIKKSKLRGEESHGMLCSASELGLEEKSDGILELPFDAPSGQDLREYLLLDDCVFDIDLTPNRADCYSALGVARELAVKNNLELASLSQDKPRVNLQEKLSVAIEDPQLCPKYAGCIIRGINPNASIPLWMQERLRRCGLRTLHPVVDIINYIMLDIGQPMHAFDLASIDGGIIVRQAKASEELNLLNGQKVKLTEDILIIADDTKPLALAGIMGGEQSSVSDTTKDIFLESAFFNPIAIANKARTYGLASDSSQRYERGVDPNLCVRSLERAAFLIQKIMGGEVGEITYLAAEEYLPSENKIKFNPLLVKRLVGIDIGNDIIERTLSLLGMSVDSTNSIWDVLIPSHRFDISLDVDLVEEVARVYGFDKIPMLVSKVDMCSGSINVGEKTSSIISNYFASRGYHETISYSFVDPKIQRALFPEEQTKNLVNPISPELSEMRISLWPGLLSAMIHNMHRRQTGIKLFESGVVFRLLAGKHYEEEIVSGLITGNYGELNWSESSGMFDYYDMKGDLESLFSLFNKHAVKFLRSEHSALHPGKSAKIVIDRKEVGVIGVLHPHMQDAFGVSEEVILFELSLNAFVNNSDVIYQHISKYPQTRRDLSLLVAKDVSAMQIESAIREVVPPSNLKAFDIFDVYVDDSLPRDKKSIALALTLQDDNKTLVDSDINNIMQLVLDKLANEYDIILRSAV